MSEENDEEQLDFHEGVGGRKTSSARVRIYPDEEGTYVINGKNVDDYFHTLEQRKKAKQPLKAVGEEKLKVTVKVQGGGINSQSEAVRHGLARALEEYNEDYRSTLKSLGYLTRDARMKEREKPGKRGARRSPQWRKR